MANKITTIVDFQMENAKSGLSNLKTAVGDAEGAFGKLKAGVGSLGDTIKSAIAGPGGLAIAGSGIAAAGAAAFGAVSKFSDLGVEIGKFADATGLSNEQASRWIEVAGDIGIDAGTLEGVIGKMNKAIGTTPGLFRSAGIEIATAKDGTVDANQTFLNAIDTLNRIEDPAKKAALGAKLFGKGWQSVSELVGQGSDKIVQSLKAVEDVKVFDESKVDKARKFRAAMDQLHDSVEDLVLTMGTQLEPVIEKIVQIAAKATTAYLGNNVATREAVNSMIKLKDEADAAGLNWFKLNNAVVDGKISLEEATAQIHDATAALVDNSVAGQETDRETRNLTRSTGELVDAEGEAAQALDEMKRHGQMTTDSIKRGLDEDKAALDNLKGNVDDHAAWTNLELEFDSVKQAGVDMTDAVKNGADDARTKTLEYSAALDGLKSKVIDYATKVLGLPTEQVTKIVATVDPQSITDAEALLAALTRNRDVSVGIVAKGGAGFGTGKGQPFASGGYVPPTPGGRQITVAEAGKGEYIIPEDQMGGGGGGLTVNVFVSGHVMAERDLVRAVADGIIDGQRRGEITAGFLVSP